MKKITACIPSLLTSVNLMLGILAILVNHPVDSLLLIVLALFFDVFDGLTARWLKAASAFGKQLDSLADIVTFGVAPAVLLYHHCLDNSLISKLLLVLIPLFSAIRLARFNTDESESMHFSGLPTPANGLFMASLPVLIESGWLKSGSWLLPVMIVFFSLLMIAPLRMFSFKKMNRGGADTFIPLIFLLVVLIAVFWLKLYIIPAGVLLYVLFSVIYHLTSQFNRTKKL
jgi:CDP-diacylglycerol---serine O-phosphatidyltransferase